MNNACLNPHHNTCVYKESANIGHKDIPCTHLHQHQSQEQLQGHLSPAAGASPRPALVHRGGHWAWAPECSRPWMSTRQCWGCILPLCQGTKLHSLARGVVSLVLLLPTFQPLLVVGPSFPLCQIISWSQITSAEQTQLEFLLHLLFVNRTRRGSSK